MSEIRSPDRYNSPSGRARPGPDTKETGTRLVAKVMGRAEAGQPHGSQQDGDRFSPAFGRLSAEQSKNTVKND
jgi:hypothetical protein